VSAIAAIDARDRGIPAMAATAAVSAVDHSTAGTRAAIESARSGACPAT
jgi:hypothetical protein